MVPRLAARARALSRIYVDADACPLSIREILIRAALRTRLPLTFVANQWIRTPAATHIRAIQVPQGLDVADSEIARRVESGDLVVTQDIPLAALAIDKGALALHPRGEMYTRETIAQRLSLRNFMDQLRGAGVQTGGPAPLHARDRQAFANALDAWLAKAPRAPAAHPD
ncbi:MAG: YaiI/YqxD family protein [Xanthomonadales bacterium]|nr:YaiI/YqxD family protein [Xanthomonadales bacterium]MCE7930192.1 YaiI/YqxD family protein [Xanthomonadales bacterium PRO6]